MIDIHSHILPGIDDGSRDVVESLQLLHALKKQGVQRVAATPHFYAQHHSPEQFLLKRSTAYESLKKHDLSGLPEIILGAEVLYFDGMSYVDQLMDLRIQNSQLLLVEMPFEPWNRRTVNEILSINARKDCTVLLAHIERYLPFQKKELWQELLENGVKMQVNASFFLRWQSKHKAISMLNKGMIHFVGSDCHNMSTRPPLIGDAMTCIKKKCGPEALVYLQRQEQRQFFRDEVLR